MDNYEYTKLLNAMQIKMQNIENIIDPTSIKREIKDLKETLQDTTI